MCLREIALLTFLGTWAVLALPYTTAVRFQSAVASVVVNLESPDFEVPAYANQEGMGCNGPQGSQRDELPSDTYNLHANIGSECEIWVYEDLLCDDRILYQHTYSSKTSIFHHFHSNSNQQHFQNIQLI